MAIPPQPPSQPSPAPVPGPVPAPGRRRRARYPRPPSALSALAASPRDCRPWVPSPYSPTRPRPLLGRLVTDGWPTADTGLLTHGSDRLEPARADGAPPVAMAVPGSWQVSPDAHQDDEDTHPTLAAVAAPGCVAVATATAVYEGGNAVVLLGLS